MSFSKTLVSGKFGSVVVSESAGKVCLSSSLSAELGGGEAKGVVSVSGGLSLNLEAKSVVDLGFDLAAHKFPAAAPLIKAAQDAVDAELAKA